MKIKFAIISVALLLLAVFVPSEAKAGQKSGGLWCSYGPWSGKEQLMTENMDHENFDAHLMDLLGQFKSTETGCKGYIQIDEAGNYDFRMDVLSERIYRFRIDWVTVMDNWGYGRGDTEAHGVYLSKGWHSINFHIRVPSWATDAQAQLYWRPPSNPQDWTGWEIIPGEKLGYYHWANDSITIPSSGGPKKVDFVTAGAGGNDKTSLKIEIDAPANIMADETWLVWYRGGSSPQDLDVTNEYNGATQTITGTRGRQQIYDDNILYNQVYANLPSSLIDPDPADGRLKLRFERIDPTETFYRGLAIIVPYEDPTLTTEGYLSFKLHSFNSYHTIAPVTVYPVEGDTWFKPLFIMEVADTRLNLGDSTNTNPWRPNYMTWLTGSGDPPEIDDVLKFDHGADYLLPQNAVQIDENDPDTFYPTYGREGPKMDVVSPNWVPNYWPDVYNQYEDASREGLMGAIHIPSGHEWIALQYATTNFPEDREYGSGESGGWGGGGAFVRELPKFDLDVTVIGSGTVASNPAGINCGGDCSEEYEENEIVTLTATPAAGGSFISWENGCTGSDPECALVMDRDTNVTARFFTPSAACGTACHQSHCVKPTTNLCVPPSTVSAAGIVATEDGWEWTCQVGASTKDCDADRDCGWVER